MPIIRIANDGDTIAAMQADAELKALRRQIYPAFVKYKYTYNFTWHGRPIIQMPEDVLMIQELIVQVKPDLIVETGIAHGGSLALSASMLELLGGSREVIGIDVDIRAHNRQALERHPLFKRMHLIEGSSIDGEIVDRVKKRAEGRKAVMVVLDSNHTHDHVLQELRFYAPLVTQASYVVVFDTVVDELPADTYPDRPWGPGNSPKSAVREFLQSSDRFTVDREIESRLLFSTAPSGYLKCIKD